MSIHNMPEYRRECALHRFKKLLAWIGVIIAGSLLVFSIGLVWLVFGPPRPLSVALFLIITWGMWGVRFLKTRH